MGLIRFVNRGGTGAGRWSGSGFIQGGSGTARRHFCCLLLLCRLPPRSPATTRTTSLAIVRAGIGAIRDEAISAIQRSVTSTSHRSGRHRPEPSLWARSTVARGRSFHPISPCPLRRMRQRKSCHLRLCGRRPRPQKNQPESGPGRRPADFQLGKLCIGRHSGESRNSLLARVACLEGLDTGLKPV